MSTPKDSILSSPIRLLFAIEAALNMNGAITMLFSPKWILSHISWSAPPDTTSIQLVQWLGAFTVALTAPLLLSLPETPGAGARRRITYQTMLIAEISLVLLFGWQAAGIGVSDEKSALSRQVLLISLAVLVPFGTTRAMALGFKEEWFQDSSVGFSQEGTIERRGKMSKYIGNYR